MRIDSIQLYRLPCDAPVDSSATAATTTAPAAARRESILARLTSGEHSGWGEVNLAAAPVESDQWSAGAFACLRDWLAPAILGSTIVSGEALQEALAPYHGNHAARSVLDTAWWALAAAARRKPLVDLIDGTRVAIPVSRTLGVMESSERLLSTIGQTLAAGYDHVTLKLRPGWAVEMLRAVRQAFPAEPIAIDCDGGCTLGQQEMFYRLEDFFLKYIEQPLPADDLVGHAMLQENVRTPLALDQSVTSLERAEQILDLGSCRMVRVELARVGGLTPALAIERACSAAQIRCLPGGARGTALARGAALTFAARCQGALEVAADAPDHPLWLCAPRWLAPEKNAAGKLEIALADASRGGGGEVDETQLAQAALETALIS
ncbi:MAG: enolase C-terminal domain-like protein [Pirellulales bacterium]